MPSQLLSGNGDKQAPSLRGGSPHCQTLQLVGTGAAQLHVIHPILLMASEDPPVAQRWSFMKQETLGSVPAAAFRAQMAVASSAVANGTP